REAVVDQDGGPGSQVRFGPGPTVRGPAPADLGDLAGDLLTEVVVRDVEGSRQPRVEEDRAVPGDRAERELGIARRPELPGEHHIEGPAEGLHDNVRHD